MNEKPKVVLIGNDVPGSRDIMLSLIARNNHIRFTVVITKGLTAKSGNLQVLLKFLRKASLKFLTLRSLDLIWYKLGTDKLVNRIKESNTNYFYSKNINSEVTLNSIEEENPSLILVLYSMHIVEDNFLEKFGSITLGVHPSFVPAYRGLEPFFWVLANNERNSGVSLFKIAKKIDAGSLLSQSTFLINENETVRHLYYRSTLLISDLIQDYLSIKFPNDTRPSISNVKSSYFGMPTRESFRSFRKTDHRWK